MMISKNGVEHIKAMCELQADLITGGVIYLISDGYTYTWKKSSAEFDLDIFKVGERLDPDSVNIRAIKENKTLVINVPRSLYGVRLKIAAEPIVNDDGQVVGAFSSVFPIEHPLIKAFKVFAPIMSDMFSDGAVLFITDLNKFLNIQHSKKFQMPELQLGESFRENSTAFTAIKTKKSVSLEYDASAYGVPVLAVCHPIFSEAGEVLGTFGLIIPKVAAANLKEMSNNLEKGLEEITFTIEELAASASNIHINQQNLYNSINEIANLSKEINEVSAFIKAIADQTKMLGLNAAIEAARAGEVGRGFGVVADEIRKLSDQSKSTVPKIQKLTDEIILKVTESREKSHSSLASSQEQASSTEEITASIEEITALSEQLDKIAHEL